MVRKLGPYFLLLFAVLMGLLSTSVLNNTTNDASEDVPVCPCGGWVTEGTGSEALHSCFCLNPYFYGVTGRNPTLPIEYAPAIDWQCMSFNDCVIPKLP